MSVLVDVEEIRALVRGLDHGGFTGEALQDRLLTADRVIRKLIAGGHLKTETMINPINRCPTVIVTAEEGRALRARIRLAVRAGEATGTAFPEAEAGARCRRRQAGVCSGEGRGDVLSEGRG